LKFNGLMWLRTGALGEMNKFLVTEGHYFEGHEQNITQVFISWRPIQTILGFVFYFMTTNQNSFSVWMKPQKPL